MADDAVVRNWLDYYEKVKAEAKIGPDQPEVETAALLVAAILLLVERITKS